LRGEFEPIFEDVEVGAAPADEDEEPARPLIRRLSSTGEVLLVETGGSRVSRAGHVLSMDDQLSDDGDRLAPALFGSAAVDDPELASLICVTPCGTPLLEGKVATAAATQMPSRMPSAEEERQELMSLRARDGATMPALFCKPAVDAPARDHASPVEPTPSSVHDAEDTAEEEDCQALRLVTGARMSTVHEVQADCDEFFAVLPSPHSAGSAA
jgi:hypothetical protein